MMSMLRAIFKPFLRFCAGLLFRVEVYGDKSQLKAKKLLIAANHESFLDGLLLGLYLPVDPVFVVHTSIANNVWFKMMLSMVDYLAVDPTSPMAMKKVIKLVESGRPVVIFPEGRITTTGSMMKVYEGPAFVAAKTSASLVPVRLSGTGRSYFSRMKADYPRRWFPQISMTILSATEIPMSDLPTAKLRRRKAGDMMRHLMQTMYFASSPKQTLFHALLDVAAILGRKRSMLTDIKQIEYTYRDIIKMSLALGRMVARETKNEHYVGILMPNMAPNLGLIFGLTAFGRTPAMLNYTAGTDGLQSACTAAEVKTIVTSHAFLEQAKLTEQVAALSNIRILYLEDLKTRFNWLDKLWLMAFALPFSKLATKKSHHETPALVLFTSGSEGKPKGVVLSHRAIIANVMQARAVIDFSVNEKVLNALPMFHSFGLTAGTLLPILSGANLFLYPSPLHYRVIPEIAYDRGCTVLFGTSTFLGNYAKFANPYDFYSMRYVVAGGEKLNENVRDIWFEKFGIRILEGYGATETAPFIAVNTPMDYRKGTVGQLLPGMEARLISVPGINNGGQLHVSGPNVMSGYFRFENPGQLETPSSDVGHGWYNTGDIVEIDADGFIKIVGRVKRFAKVAGEMVSLEVVEKMAVEASSEAQTNALNPSSHAATTQADEQRGETILLYTTDTSLTREQLQAIARKNGWPEIAVPRKIIVVDSLPLLGTGKTDYVSLKKMAESA